MRIDRLEPLEHGATYRRLLAERAAARAAARHQEAARRRDTRTRRHIGIGAAAGLAFLVLAPLADDVLAYAAAVVAFAVAVGSAVRAVDLLLGSGWRRRSRPPKRITRLDRAVVRIMDRLSPKAARDDGADPPAIRVLPPEPGRPERSKRWPPA